MRSHGRITAWLLTRSSRGALSSVRPPRAGYGTSPTTPSKLTPILDTFTSTPDGGRAATPSILISRTASYQASLIGSDRARLEAAELTRLSTYTAPDSTSSQRTVAHHGAFRDARVRIFCSSGAAVDQLGRREGKKKCPPLAL